MPLLHRELILKVVIYLCDDMKAEKQKSLFLQNFSPLITFYKIQYIYAASQACEQFHDLIFGNACGRARAFC